MRYSLSVLLQRASVLLLSVAASSAIAVAANAQSRQVYTPIPMPASNQVADTLSANDIPTGDGGFARDYTVNLAAGDQISIELTSDSFDTIVILMASDGSIIGQNDDGPDGSSNSLLFARIKDSGRYIVRVRAFGETGSGPFNLRLTRLQPVD